MDLGNPFEVIVHYLLIRRMINLSNWDKFFMVNALVCMVTHQTRPMVNHKIDYRVIMTLPS